MTPSIERARGSAAAAITSLTGELLEEIQAAMGERVFRFDAARNQAQLERALEAGRFVVFLAQAPHPHGGPLGFLALCEGFALYAEGCFGIITELSVAPPHRGWATAARCWPLPGSMGAPRAGAAWRCPPRRCRPSPALSVSTNGRASP